MTDALDRLLSSPLESLLFVLGVFGWWRLIARDSLTESLRQRFFIEFPYGGFCAGSTRPKRGSSVFSAGSWYTERGTMLGELLYCPWCLSWWIALSQFAVFTVAPELVMVLAIAHAGRIVTGFLADRA